MSLSKEAIDGRHFALARQLRGRAARRTCRRPETGNLFSRPGFRFLLLAAAVLLCSTQLEAMPRATVESGRLVGVREGSVDAFLGIPYAAAPVGNNRWRAPQPALAWEGVRKAQHFGASCWQSVNPQGFGPWTREYVVQGAVSEDCLYLNVWAPRRPTRPLPVMIWIHGGGFDSGSASVPIYNGRNIASAGIVVVTINYRLGVFGFLAHPDISREANGNPPGNFGLQDMIAALKWVRTNISAFGGDPSAVTIAGQSAGAVAVHDLITSPMAKGLFHRAIAQSGLPSTIAAVPLGDAEQAGVAHLRSLGISTIDELRALPPDRVTDNAKGFAPVVDGVLLQHSPVCATVQGSFANVPILVGITADEGSAMRTTYGAGDLTSFQTLLAAAFGASASQFSALYPAATDSERALASKQLLRDRGLAALYFWARHRTECGKERVYTYLFDHVEPGPQSARWLAFHSSEIPYIFRTLDASPERRFTAADQAISRRISTYWINFILRGDPNGPGLEAWPNMNATAPEIAVLGNRIRASEMLAQDKLQAMNAYVSDGGKIDIF